MQIIKIGLSLLSSIIFTGTISSQVSVKSYPSTLSATTIERVEQTMRETRALSSNQISFYLTVHNADDLTYLAQQYNLHINLTNGCYATARGNIAVLPQLAKDARVTSIDVGQKVVTMLDNARTVIHADQATSGENLSRAYRGKKVIVGIVDAGFDFLHPAFKDTNGKTRINIVWDQNSQQTDNNPYGYGKVFEGDAVTSAVRDRELLGDTHGTHVLAIASASQNSPYYGIAPEAELAVVSTNKTEQGILEGVDFLLQYAQKKQMPIAINLSMGTVMGLKDGTGNFAQMLDKMLDGRKGQLLAIAAGNEGERLSSIALNLDKQKSAIKSYWATPSYGRDGIMMECEADAHIKLTLTLEDTISHIERFSHTWNTDNVVAEQYTDFGGTDDEPGTLTATVNRLTTTNKPIVNISLVYRKAANEVWKVTVDGEGKALLTSDHGAFTALNQTSYTEGTNLYTVAATATGYKPIVVGATVTRNEWQDLTGKSQKRLWTIGERYPLSGQGPTSDGRIKPDVVAPGAAIVSAFSSFASTFTVKSTDKVYTQEDLSTGKKYTWGVESGTSMATPVVTGTLALMLEANPQLTIDEARQLLIDNANKIGEESLPNAGYGYGLIDVAKTLQQLEGSTDIMEVKQDYILQVVDNKLIANHTKKPVWVRIFSITGMELVRGNATSGIDLSTLQHGILIVQQKGGKPIKLVYNP